jgi:hypothetical protein
MKYAMIEVGPSDASSGGDRGGTGCEGSPLKTMTRAEFAAVPGAQHVEAYITFDHGADRAAIHQDLKNATVRNTLALYPIFDSIRITRLIVPQPSAYAGKAAE